jgi:hypothetical protein
MIFDSEKEYSVPCTENSLRTLQQCIGVWEIDPIAVKNAGNDLKKLGVCQYHFNLDQYPLYHQSGIKQNNPVHLAKLLSKRCLFCYKIFKVYSRGNHHCEKHSWQVINKNLLTSCICQFKCPSITDKILINKSNCAVNGSFKSRYICQGCYHKNGGHIYTRPGKGKKPQVCSHQNDTEEVLRKIGSWIINIANSNNLEEKQNLLSNLVPSLAAHWNNSSQKNPSYSPSTFLINTILKLRGADKLHEDQKDNLNPDKSFNNGELLGKFILKSKGQIKEHKEQLANPSSLNEYYEAFPKVITRFFDGFIGVILKHHHDLKKYKKQYYKTSSSKIDDNDDKEQDKMQLIKINTFLSSIITTMAYRRSHIWLTRLFASLCRRPQFLKSLQSILHSVYVISHTADHERPLRSKKNETG